jgi:hypothetical protein
MQELPYVRPDTYLFRYMDHRTDYFWSAITDMLTEQKLFLNSRAKFNDPYDSQPEIQDDVSISDIRYHADEMVQNPWRMDRAPEDVLQILKLREQGRTHLTRKQLGNIKASMLQSASEFLDECGLMSFSLISDHPLLWGHYAAGSAGVCVVFRRGISMQSALCVCAEVSYVEARPRLPTRLLLEMVRTQRAGSKSFGEIADKVFSLSFLHKSKEWEYEREARIFYPFSASKKIKFDRKELVSIIVGPKAPTDLENKLKQATNQFTPEVTIHRALLSQNGYGIIAPNNLGNAA